jgi:hypothetical protein
MEECGLGEIAKLLSELKQMDIDIKIVIYSDLSGHLEESGFPDKRIKGSEFYGLNEISFSLAKQINNRINRKKIVKSIFDRFKKI